MSASFTVDTHVFRELGELLVGRDSTALIELIKNSYDADATEVTIFGSGLDDTEHGFILIADNGTGMTPDQFRRGFLRIASRGKEEGDRRSLRYKRRFTGAKGIGRLAAHKLAQLVIVTSVPAPEISEKEGVKARIDWHAVEQYQTLEDLAASPSDDAIQVESLPVSKKSKMGTEIRLERLRRAWTNRELIRFVSEVQSFSPPAFLLDPDPALIQPQKFLFGHPRMADYSVTAPFLPKLGGDFATGEDFWPALAADSDWFIEIDGTKDAEITFQLTPTRMFRSNNPAAEQQIHKVPRKDKSVPRFQARIIVREGSQGVGSLRGFATNNSGIRIFMEGFRVLPYGERSNDWLELDRNYAERTRTSEYLTEFKFSSSEQNDDKDAMLQSLPNRAYYGSVFLTQEGAPTLQMLVNREGFVPNSGFDTLSRMVRLGIDLTVRARAAAKLSKRVAGSKQFEQPAHESDSNLETAVKNIANVRGLIVQGDIKQATKLLQTTESQISDFSERTATEATMLRILASVGSQMSVFVHEINASLGMAEGVESALTRLIANETNPSARRDLNKALQQISDLRRQLERQASYLVDINSPDARRRRSRRSLSERFESAVKLVSRAAEQRDISISNKIPSALKSNPMFPAELTSVFTNLLTNAIKAAGSGGRIEASGAAKVDGQGVVFRLDNTGAKVDLEDGERWFAAFESTTAEVDSVLGQGMGLGLTITRNMLEQYGATIKFVRPLKSFASAIEISFPK